MALFQLKTLDSLIQKGCMSVVEFLRTIVAFSPHETARCWAISRLGRPSSGLSR